MSLEKAKVSDVPQIHKLVNFFASREEMLPRSLAEIYENIRDFFVVRQENRVVACVALHVSWADLAEIRSMAVAEEVQGQGFGAQLVEACLDEAGKIGIETVFCLTYRPTFFEKFGFGQVDKMELPRKVWSECFHCPKFPDCDEVALVYQSKEAGRG